MTKITYDEQAALYCGKASRKDEFFIEEKTLLVALFGNIAPLRKICGYCKNTELQFRDPSARNSYQKSI